MANRTTPIVYALALTFFINTGVHPKRNEANMPSMYERVFNFFDGNKQKKHGQ